MSLGDKLQAAVWDAIRAFSTDSDKVYEEARYLDVESWKRKISLQSGLAGIASSVIPGAHLAGDIPVLVNRMSAMAYGVGAILGYDQGLGNVLDGNDFPRTIITLTAGGHTLPYDVGREMSPEYSRVIEESDGWKLVRHADTVAPKRTFHSEWFVEEALKTAVEKFCDLLKPRVVTGFIPLFGALAAAQHNALMISQTTIAARTYFTAKCEAIKKGKS